MLLAMPVMLPPGRARLAAKPSLTGSFVTVTTMGIVAVARCEVKIPDAPDFALRLRQCATRRNERARDKRNKKLAAAVHSITLSARRSNSCGTANPIALAVLRLIASDTLVGCSIGSSPGFAPFRILST